MKMGLASGHEHAWDASGQHLFKSQLHSRNETLGEAAEVAGHSLKHLFVLLLHLRSARRLVEMADMMTLLQQMVTHVYHL